MPLSVLTTTARAIVGADEPSSFVIVNDALNTVNIRISSVDSRVTESYDTLVPGQDMSFEDFVGVVYALAVSAEANYAVEFRSPGVKIVKG